MSFWGKYLEIDLTYRAYRTIDINSEVYEKYIGGNGIGAYLLYKYLKPNVDPLSDENIIIINTGPANGTIAPMASKFCVVSKSPQTLGFTKGFCGGEFGEEIKYAGYDGIVIKGASDSWIYLYMEDNKVFFEDASNILGFYTTKTQEWLQEKHKDAKTIVIGPAGENLVKYACLISELRAVGTGGIGAVFGAKKLKGIAIKGSLILKPKNEKRLKDFVLDFYKKVYAHPGVKNLKMFGTAAGLMHLQKLAALPSYNWQKETFEYAFNISGEALREKVIKDVSCFGCIVPCGKYSVSKDTFTIGPEYEGIFSLGTIIGNGNLDELISLDRLTDELGLGQIQTGGVLAWAMECYEKGIFDIKTLDGLDLRFGNTESAKLLLKKIAFREGIGDILAEGSSKASDILGGKEYTMCVKNMEIAGHSPRAVKTQAVGYAISNRGPVHCDVRPGIEENNVISFGVPDNKGKESKDLVVWSSIVNSIIYCLSAERVVGLKLNQEIINMLNAVMDSDLDFDAVYKIGERIYTLERLFNVRDGFSSKDDTLPKRIMEEPSEVGRVTKEEELKLMIEEFYEAFGWDKDGKPTKDTLVRLGLEEFL